MQHHQPLYQPRQGQTFQQPPEQQYQQPGVSPSVPAPGDPVSELRDLVTTLASTSTQKFNKLEQFMEVAAGKFMEIEAGQRNQQALLQDMDTKIGHLADALASKPAGTLPGQPLPNPRNHKEGLHAIMLRSGTVTADAPQKSAKKVTHITPEPEEDLVMVKEPEDQTPKPQPIVAEYKPKLPFPTRIHKDRLEAEFGNSSSMLRKLHVQVPFMEALSQMPKYAKFLK
ncbi:unnamed protein product [Linum trigynum]|uniref:Uncharacterized protein n=1 Tax=Linum trigynum TaxID=586398 RepID=A0AAV2G5S1_9ROSI